MDLNAEALPPHVLNTLLPSAPARLRYLLHRLLPHLHQFLLETRPTTHEWKSALRFLTDVGKTCTDSRDEFMLLSDVLGVSTLVEILNHPVPPGATPGSVLGPFHTHAPEVPNGANIVGTESNGERVLIRCTVKNTRGESLEGVSVDVWETDETGRYDVQYPGQERTDCRGVLRSDKEGRFWFKAIRPVSYSIPDDGPVGKLLKLLGRHPYRPAHVHFLLKADGYEELVTSLYMKGDPYENSDVVFGVKSALIVDLKKIEDETLKKEYGLDGEWSQLSYDFVLVGLTEAEQLRVEEGMEALVEMEITGVEWVGGLPVMPVD